MKQDDVTDYLGFAGLVVARQVDHLLDEGPVQQTITVASRLARFAKTTLLTPISGKVRDLAGFGEAPVHYQHDDTDYLLLSEIAEALGWFLPRAHAWADTDHAWAVREQRRADEERGDGLLGYDLLRGLVDLGLTLALDDPEARPDGGGRRWSDAGDWLVADYRLPALLLVSPWGKEFMDNTSDHFGLTLRKTYGDAVGDLFRTDLTEEEALRKARRGPALDTPDGGNP
ncbi:hypothetical protein RM844_28870 [Streptomyces sp. DSM 44915]|uniref:Uncharacterized protein n=1 Tax=Streptomyces chisholmiae TaxID=3075540 RepID=A0ABU2JZU9_9ACTN|nr:hypothetical protein [Streptomyces sp. DSM 44915]MDT0270279.1 hypothetical protein [Streptomyces sp. DSM 44915]MDT0270291.1 hypothetical protein [Streptomyces sp. DSM 44915]